MSNSSIRQIRTRGMKMSQDRVVNYNTLTPLANSHVIGQQHDGTFGFNGSNEAWKDLPLMGIFCEGQKNKDFQRERGYDPRKCAHLVMCYGCHNCEQQSNRYNSKQQSNCEPQQSNCEPQQSKL